MNGEVVGPKIVRLRRRNLGRYAHTLYQEDFEKCIAKRIRVRQELKELDEIERYIATALRSGAVVEPGLYTPELITVNRKPYKAKGGTYYHLEIKR